MCQSRSLSFKSRSSSKANIAYVLGSWSLFLGAFRVLALHTCGEEMSERKVLTIHLQLEESGAVFGLMQSIPWALGAP